MDSFSVAYFATKKLATKQSTTKLQFTAALGIMNFNQAAALYRLGELPSEKMVEVAMSALEAGADAEEIVMLAIETDKTLGTLKPLFDSCLKHLELDSLSEEEILEYAAEYYASLVKSGKINAIQFGFKIGSHHEKYGLKGDLWNAYQNAMWYEEAPYEYGYPKDLESLRKLQKECSNTISRIVDKYA